MKSVKSCVRNNTLPVGPFSPAYALKKLSPEEPSPVRWISSIFPSPVFINLLFFLFPVFPPPSFSPPSSFSLNLYEVINGINKRVTFFCPNEPRGNVSRSFPTASIWMLNGLMAPSVVGSARHNGETSSFDPCLYRFRTSLCAKLSCVYYCFTTFQWWTYESLQHLSCFGFFRKYETNRVYLPRKIQTFVSSFFSNFLPFYDSVRFSKNWYPPLKLLQFSISSRCSGKMHAISLQRSTQMFIQISVVGLWPREREINESWDEEQGSNAAVGRASQLRAICVCTGEGRKRKRTGNRARNVHAGVCPRHPISYPPPCCWNSVMTVARLDWFTP